MADLGSVLLAGAGWLVLFGLLLLIIGVVLLAAMKAKGLKTAVPVFVFSAVLLGLGLFAGSIAPAPASTGGTGTTTPCNGCATTSYVVTTNLPSGCTWNSISETLTCDVVYNYTSNYFGVEPANQSTCNFASNACHPTTYVLVPIHSARSDVVNQTFGENYQISSIPTATSLGANAQVYSIVAYTQQTASSTGQWHVKWSTGSFSGQFPNQPAPQTTTGIGLNTVGIQSFSSAQPVLSIGLAGSNSTSAPTTFYSALSTFTAYDMGVSISGSTPASITIAFVVLGEHA